jgi:2-dehydropantoate 2-reductase
LTAGPARITVFGTGAMACLFGGRLARAGAAATLVGTWPEALRALADDGITLLERGASVTAAVAAAPLGRPLRPADFVLVLVKSHQTAAVARFAAAAVRPSGLIATLQNGLGNRETLEAAAGHGGVAQGVAVVGATLLAPAQVRVIPGTVALGLDVARPALVHQLVALLREAGFDAAAFPDVGLHAWRKLAANCAINPLSALAGLPNGAVLADPERRRTMEAAAREVAAVATARGIPLSTEDAVNAARAVAAETAENRSSMLQDLDRGARTEIEALCGAVAREGRRLGLPTPVNERLWEAVLARERAGARVAAPLA